MSDLTLTTQEAADLAACSRQAVVKAIHQGKLSASIVKVEGRYVYRLRREDVEQWIARSPELSFRRKQG